jgi:peptidoglycan/xylan/chitin deacetylase (PgdA/CDA1 family)
VPRLIFSAVLMAACACATLARAEGVALTFDDLPTMALTGAAPYAQTTTKSLLDGLRRHHLPATGFVIGERLEGDGGVAHAKLVNQWLAAGMQLGNHTYSHLSLNKTPIEDYIADVGRADGALKPLLAARRRPLRWFRHPYLETGLTIEARRTFEDWLTAHGYRVAPVTMENSDYVFALPYDDAILRHDSAGAARIKQAYLDHTAKVVAWYRAAGLQLLGRRPSFVFLLHATRLNADSLDELAAILRRNDLHAITLDRAMRDPAYRIADDYAGPDGDEWLSRWSRTLHKALPWDSFPEPPADIAAENDRLDTSP